MYSPCATGAKKKRGDVLKSIYFILILLATLISCANPTGNSDPKGELIFEGWTAGKPLNYNGITISISFKSTYNVELSNVYINVSLSCDDSITVGSATGESISIPPQGRGTCQVYIPYQGVTSYEEITTFTPVLYWDYGILQGAPTHIGTWLTP